MLTNRVNTTTYRSTTEQPQRLSPSEIEEASEVSQYISNLNCSGLNTLKNLDELAHHSTLQPVKPVTTFDR